MSKHTQGPFKVHEKVKGLSGPAVFSANGGHRYVAVCESLADATLFSAAPEMLDALKVAYTELENHIGVPGVEEHVIPCILAAIAKAEGRG